MRPLFRIALGLFVVLVIASCSTWPVARRLNELSFQLTPGFEPVQFSFVSVPLDPEDESELRAGDLVYRGGLALSSRSPHFGGFSGLIVAQNGRSLLSISDRALWMTAKLEYDDNALSGISAVQMSPMLNDSGSQLLKPYYDAEGLTIDAGNPFDPGSNGTVLVSFETKDRVLRYSIARDGGSAKGEEVPTPIEISKLINNKGLEGLVRLVDGRLLAISERSLDSEGRAKGWIIDDDGSSVSLTYEIENEYHVTDLARGPDGAVYALERRFTQLAGPGMRIKRLDPNTLRAGGVVKGKVLCELDISLTVDNMEGLSVIAGPSGETLFYVISDDNLNALQRTLLMVFELSPDKQ